MAAITLNFTSQVLGREEDLCIVYPTTIRAGAYSRFVYEPGVTYQVLWLLHGGFENYSDWLRFSRIECYAEEAHLIVVMPTIRDLHINCNGRGGDYIKYLGEELPAVLGGMFPISMKREDNFIAALSYGGYFAYRTVFRYPQHYATIGTFSSPVDSILDSEIVNAAIDRAIADGKPAPEPYRPTGVLRNTDADVPYMVKKSWDEGVDLPLMFQACGTDDKTYRPNLSFLERLRQTGYARTWVEDMGNHDWEYWDSHVKMYIDWNPFIRRAPIHPER
jgi:putative tributyrin esterase